MIRASWNSLAAILVWATLVPVLAFWLAAEWKRERHCGMAQARRKACRLCWGEYEAEATCCPWCGDGGAGGDLDGRRDPRTVDV